MSGFLFICLLLIVILSKSNNFIFDFSNFFFLSAIEIVLSKMRFNVFALSLSRGPIGLAFAYEEATNEINKVSFAIDLYIIFPFL